MMRELITSLLLAGTSAGLLGLFVCIWIYGTHYIQEPNLLTLVMETLGIAGILFLAIYNLVHLLRNKQRQD